MYVLRAQVWGGKPKEVKYFNSVIEDFGREKTFRQYMADNPIFTADIEGMMRADGMEGPYKFREIHWVDTNTNEFVVVGKDEFTLEEAGWTAEEITKKDSQ